MQPGSRQSGEDRSTDRLIAALQPVFDRARLAKSPEREASRRMWRALVLAPDLDVFEALLRDEPVPLSRLDPDALKRTRRAA